MSLGLSPRDMDLVGLRGASRCLHFFTSSQVTDGSDTRATLGEALTQLIPWTLGDQLGEHPPEGFVGVVCPPVRPSMIFASLKGEVGIYVA